MQKNLWYKNGGRISGASRWLSTVFDIYVSFTFFSNAFVPSAVKTGRKQVNNTNFVFFYGYGDVGAVAMAT